MAELYYDVLIVIFKNLDWKSLSKLDESADYGRV